MTYTLQFLPEIEEDAIKGYIWYDEKSRGLGEDFLRMFYAAANEIPWNPLVYPKVYHDFRRRLLRRFPYAIYYTVEDNRIIVFGLFHCARNPQVVNEILEKREQ